jgi:hypothetical protein
MHFSIDKNNATSTYFDTHICKHIGTSLSSEGSVSLGPNILGTNRNVPTKSLSDLLDVDLGRADNNFGLSAQSGLVEHGKKFCSLGDGSITFPVSSDEELACFDLGRGGVCAGSDLGDGRGD